MDVAAAAGLLRRLRRHDRPVGVDGLHGHVDLVQDRRREQWCPCISQLEQGAPDFLVAPAEDCREARRQVVGEQLFVRLGMVLDYAVQEVQGRQFRLITSLKSGTGTVKNPQILS